MQKSDASVHCNVSKYIRAERCARSHITGIILGNIALQQQRTVSRHTRTTHPTLFRHIALHDTSHCNHDL
eukprot:3510494-Rhodomonas_salina.2